jgi:hypothetical protein
VTLYRQLSGTVVSTFGQQVGGFPAQIPIFLPMTWRCRVGLPFPKRIIVQVDSETARSFSNNSCKKSKLKHIDCRQEWVQVLRDKDILKCVHIPGTENLADLFTKILDPGDFIRQRGAII